LFQTTLGIKATIPELQFCRHLAELVCTRAARLSACGVAAISKKMNYKSCRVGADGTLFHKYLHFQERQAKALREIFGWGNDVKDDLVKVVAAEDGSGVGAGLIAALTLKRARKGSYVGIRDAQAILKVVGDN
jgi:hexokinase